MRSLRYLSLCSGIEAASVAWEPLGWQPIAFSEIEPFPCAVLARHYPDVPNLGDMTMIDGSSLRGHVHVLVGGTPCQSFSVAGQRRGLNDERGNLAIVFARLADECNPAFIVWENVPGVLSDRGNAFGFLLSALAGENAPLLPPGRRWTDAGYVLGSGRAIAWRILDAQYFGLAQCRRRVFVVACPCGGADPRKVLFEFGGLRRDTPPSREKGQEITQSLARSLGTGGPDDNRAQGRFYVPQTHSQAVTKVRRLTPWECERLQGFPDGYTDVIFRGKPAKDALRYRALGNAMAVPVMRWLGERIMRCNHA